jgi:sec-independent protein translocase protein TatA
MRGIGVQELLILALIVLLLFGAARLPKLARSMREARDEFQKGSTEGQEGGEPAAQPSSESSTAEAAPAADKPQEKT